MKFSEMIYERPDIDVFRKSAQELMSQFEKAENAADADKIFLEWDKLSSHIDTMMSLAYSRHTIDTTDAFYENEVGYIDEISPLFSEIGQNFTKLLVNSPFRTELEEKYGKLMFINGEMFLRSFSPEIIPLLQQTNQLETAYQKLIASAQIDFQGEKRTVSQMQPFKQSPDDDVRRSAWLAEGGFYSENGSDLDTIYDKMVALRTEMAHKLGFDNYVPLGYLNMTRNCYTPEDISVFRKAIVKYIVPVAEKIYRAQAERTGLPYPMSFADAALAFRDGNPRPCGTPDDILNTGIDLYHELSEQTSDFIDVMVSSELLDLLSKKGKAGGGYCTQFADYKLPFIFSNFNGTADDVEVITHEAGHAFAYYCARNIQPCDNQSPTMDACEIHSMTMEFFGWRKSDKFFGNDARKFRFSHLAGALCFLPYGAMVDHFQHLVYESPELTPAQRHEIWKKLLSEYMPWLRLDGSVFYGEGHGWQRQLHIYENPFYYIDYCLAQTVALEFWVLMQNDHESAWKQYMDLVNLAGTKSFTELVSAAKLSSPFDEKTLQSVAEAALEWLNENSI